MKRGKIIGRTQRGFEDYLEAQDADGNAFRVRQSSNAEQACVWIFTDQVTGQHLGRDVHAALHLNEESAKALRNALDTWLSRQCPKRSKGRKA